MSNLSDAVATTVAAITAMGTLGTAAAGLVDASKAFLGGISNVGLAYIYKALTPFAPALDNTNPAWRELIRASWINGAPKEDQKAAVKSLIRLGLASGNAAQIAAAGHVDPAALQTALTNMETGLASSPADINVLGRLNGMIDTAMDAGFERADQHYRNASKLASGVVSVILAIWAGQLMKGYAIAGVDTSHPFWPSVLVGLLAVPIAPVVKDLTSSLQAAANAVQSVSK
jgi:hypothetical protein